MFKKIPLINFLNKKLNLFELLYLHSSQQLQLAASVIFLLELADDINWRKE
jgi:hypothetical protein